MASPARLFFSVVLVSGAFVGWAFAAPKKPRPRPVATEASSRAPASAAPPLASAAPVSSASSPPPASASAPAREVPAGSDVLTMARANLPDFASVPIRIGACEANADQTLLRFQLAHLNDLQARYSDRIAGRSRYAYIAGYLKRLKSAQPTLVLDAGDDNEKGALAELRSSGEVTRQIVQTLPIDVRVIGNHDFAYGEAAVLRDVRLSRHPLLAANIAHTGYPASDQPLRPYARFDVGCVRVGVIGLVTQNFGADDQPTKEPYFGVFVQDDHYQAILDREAKAHRGEVDVLIALTHLGYADDLALAHRGGKLVDLIVGGHSEDLIKVPNYVAHPDGTRTYIVQAGHFGETFGHGEVLISKDKKPRLTIDKYKIVEVDESLPVAEEVDALVKRLESAIVPDAHVAIGKASAPIKQGKPMSELMFRAAAATWGVDALVVGRDQFWSGLPKGEITLQRLFDAVLVQRQPSGTTGLSSIWVVELSGTELGALAKSFRAGGNYDWLGIKDKLDPHKRYRLALDKRAATFPRTLFGPEPSKLVHASYVGEMIDALEPYVRARTSKGNPID